MRGGDDNARIRAQAVGDARHAGRGQRANEQDIDAHREDAAGERALEHVAGEARVFADDNLVAAAAA
jgi:hypothetical protein